MPSNSELFPECLGGAATFRFDRFLERILYERRWGYYSSPGLKFGKGGDFYTSPHVHFFFAEILAEQILEFWEEAGRAAPFTLVEMGPGDGTLAAQILAHAQERFPELYQVLRYVGVEVSESLRLRQRERLSRFPRVDLVAGNLAEAALEPIEAGCILSNEFLDALPFRRLSRNGGGWLEYFVRVSTDRLEGAWEPIEVPPQDLAGVSGDLTLEWRDTMEAFYRFASHVLKQGAMVHLDYGERRENLNPQGTLRTFHRHTLGEDPLERLGEQDVTASVDFTHAMELGDRYGFEGRLLGQRQYLMERGILEKTALRFRDKPPGEPSVIEEKAALKDLILPGGISGHFKVLIQRRRALD